MRINRLFRSIRNGLIVGFQPSTTPNVGCVTPACPISSDAEELALALGTVPFGVDDAAFSYTPTLTGGLAPYVWELTEDSDPLPDGLTLDPATGEISGTPTTVGTTTVTVQVTDALGNEETLEIEIEVVAPLVAGLDLTPPSPQQGVAMTTYTPTVTGGLAPYAWVLEAGSDPLPAGLALNAATGEITGTPTDDGVYEFTLEVSDASDQTDTVTINMTVAPP